MNFQDFASALRSHFGSMLKNNTPDYLYQTHGPRYTLGCLSQFFPGGFQSYFQKAP